MAATAVTLNDLEGHLPVADVFKCNPSNICAAFFTILTDQLTYLLTILTEPTASFSSQLGDR